jgi:hypothetical protein
LLIALAERKQCFFLCYNALSFFGGIRKSVMNRLLEIKERLLPITVKVGIFFWMFIVILVYLSLFGPPEFWSIVERLGIWYFFKEVHVWLRPFLEAGYLE